MSMKTASFFTTVSMAGRVSIARYEPKLVRGIPAYRKLAPGPATWEARADRAEYERLFDAQLRALDPRETWDALHRLVACEVVLLCWCAKGQFCHRRSVSRWFMAELGEDVPELEVQI